MAIDRTNAALRCNNGLAQLFPSEYQNGPAQLLWYEIDASRWGRGKNLTTQFLATRYITSCTTSFYVA